MKRQKLLITLAAAIAVLASISLAGAFDTSPYLVGTWEGYDVAQVNFYCIVNPTTKPLYVQMFFYQSDGTEDGCTGATIFANETYCPGLAYIGSQGAGAVKFFAFPQGSRKFDPNAVIGGFQQKGGESPTEFKTQSNLKAVIINSYTMEEFARVLRDGCWPQ
jgi:hypothetical protein